MDPEAALRARGGAARSAHLLRAGVPRRALTAAVKAGAVERRGPGLYALPGCAAAPLAAAAVEGVLSCLDAARAHGLPVLDPPEVVHLAAPRGSERTWPGTRVHRRDVPRGGLALPLVGTLLSVAQCHSLATTVSLVDAALREGRCTAAELATASHPRDVRWRRALRLADGRAMSSIESLARVELVEALRHLGLTVELQVRLRGVGAVDLLVGGWLVVELDGFAFHADRESYRRDRLRDQALASSGYVRLRFSFEDVVRSRGHLASRVLETWSRGRPPGSVSLRVG